MTLERSSHLRLDVFRFALSGREKYRSADAVAISLTSEAELRTGANRTARNSWRLKRGPLGRHGDPAAAHPGHSRGGWGQRTGSRSAYPAGQSNPRCYLAHTVPGAAGKQRHQANSSDCEVHQRGSHPFRHGVSLASLDDSSYRPKITVARAPKAFRERSASWSAS